MRTDLYQQETAAIARIQSALLDEVRHDFSTGGACRALRKTGCCIPCRC